MNVLNNLHKIESLGNYGKKKIYNTKKSSQLAKIIHNNFHKMTIEEMKYVMIKCVDPVDMKRILLGYELMHYTPIKKKWTLKNFSKKSIEILKRFQCKAGGFHIEDYDWELYSINKKNAILRNSIDKLDAKDNETLKYMNSIVEYLNKMTSNFHVDYAIKEDNEITWIYIHVTTVLFQRNNAIINTAY